MLGREPDGVPAARAEADDARGRAVPLGGELDVAPPRLGRIRIGRGAAGWDTEDDPDYERGLVLSGS